MGEIIDRQWEPSEVPAIRDAVPRGTYRVRIKDIDTQYTQKEPPRLMYVTQIEIVEPDEVRGLTLWDRFVIGTPDDPEGEDPDTWRTFPAQRLHEMCESCGVPGNRSVAAMLRNTLGKEALASVTQNADGRNEVKRYYSIGAKLIGYGTDGAAQQTRGAPRARTMNGPARTRPDGAARQETRVAGATVRRTSSPATVECRTCGEAIPTKEYQRHVRDHERESNE